MMKRILFVILVGLMVACGSKSSNNELDKANNDTKYGDSTGVYEERYPNGKLRIKGQLTNGKRDGVWNYFYENGFIWSKGIYKEGVRNSYSMTYHKNGVKKMQGQYKDGEKVGIWKFWDDQGSLIKEVNVEEEEITE